MVTYCVRYKAVKAVTLAKAHSLHPPFKAICTCTYSVQCTLYNGNSYFTFLYLQVPKRPLGCVLEFSFKGPLKGKTGALGVDRRKKLISHKALHFRTRN